jgi:hypothetical protein
MLCNNCKEELTQDNVYPSDRRYCADCGQKHALYLQERRQTLASLRYESGVKNCTDTLSHTPGCYGIWT